MADIVAALNKLIEIEQKKARSLEVIKIILNKIYEAKYLEDIDEE